MTRSILAAILAMTATAAPAMDLGRGWSFDYAASADLASAGKPFASSLDGDLRWHSNDGRSSLFLRPHVALAKHGRVQVSSETTVVTETVPGNCRCVTINNTFQTTAVGVIDYADTSFLRAGWGFDPSPNVSASIYVDLFPGGVAPVFGAQVVVKSAGWK